MRIAHNVIQVFYEDLQPEAQQVLLDLYEVDEPEEMNWDSFPIMSLPLPDSSHYSREEK